MHQNQLLIQAINRRIAVVELLEKAGAIVRKHAGQEKARGFIADILDTFSLADIDIDDTTLLLIRIIRISKKCM